MNSIWKRRRKVETKLTVAGWVYLVFLAFITIGSILRNVNLLVLMAGLLYAPLILQWRACNKLMRSLKAIRAVPQRIHAGEPIKMTWTVRNESQQVTAWNVLVSDHIARDLSVDPAIEKSTFSERVRSSFTLQNESLGSRIKRAVVWLWKLFSETHDWGSDDGVLMSIDRVDGGQSRTGAWQVRFAQRGLYHIGPASLSSTSTLGLQACHFRLNSVQPCYVAPALGILKDGWVQRLKSMRAGDGTSMRRRGLDQEEFHALRLWRSGDSKKHIHWRTSARYGAPIVRQFDQNDDQDIAIVLDLYCPSIEERHDDQQILKYRHDVETALSFATTILSRAQTQFRGRITLGICGQQKSFFVGRQPDFLASAMKALSIAQPSPHPPLVETLLDSASVTSPGTSILVVSTRPEPDLMVLASSGQPSNDRVKEVRQAIVTSGLQRIKSAVNWMPVAEPSFQEMFSVESGGRMSAPGNRSSVSRPSSETRLVD